MMGQPHHHVYMALEKAIIKDVQIEPLIPHLISRKVLQESDIQHCQSRPKNGMKILIGYMRNQSFEAFLSFVECIFEAQRDAPSKVQAVPVVESMIRAVRDFDAKSHTTHAERLITIQGRYVKQSTVDNEAEQIQERLEGGTGTSLTTSLEHLTLQSKQNNKINHPIHVQSVYFLSCITYARPGLCRGPNTGILLLKWGRIARL